MVDRQVAAVLGAPSPPSSPHDMGGGGEERRQGGCCDGSINEITSSSRFCHDVILSEEGKEGYAGEYVRSGDLKGAQPFILSHPFPGDKMSFPPLPPPAPPPPTSTLKFLMLPQCCSHAMRRQPLSFPAVSVGGAPHTHTSHPAFPSLSLSLSLFSPYLGLLRVPLRS